MSKHPDPDASKTQAQPVEVRLRFRDDDEDLPAGESLWARSVPDARDTYELLSTSYWVPLAAGDRVRAEPDAEQRLQVTDVVEPGDSVMTFFGLADGLSTESREDLLRAWDAVGARTEGHGRLLVTVWPRMSVARVRRMTTAAQDAGLGELAATMAAVDRQRAAQVDVDFLLG